MAAQIQGFTAANILEIEANTRAARMTMRDIDYGSLGIYSLAATNGTTQMAAGLAANAAIFSLRWAQASNLLLIRRVTLSMAAGATAFTAGAAQFSLIVARSFTVVDSGGTSILPSGNQNKLRTTGMGTTGVGDARISATAALTAGTRTLDALPIGALIGGAPNVAGQSIIPPGSLLFDQRPGEHPLLLAQNEGIVIQAVVPATGTWFFGVKVDYAEVVSTGY